MKNLEKLFFLIFGISLFFSCSQEKNKLEPKKTVISGVVNNFSDNVSVLVVNYCNPLSDERKFAQNLNESNGCFHTVHEYVFAQNLTISFANKFINLFIYPGDSIFVSIDANEIQRNFNNAVAFAGDNYELNNELFLWTNYLYFIYNKNFPQYDDNTSPDDFFASVKQSFEKAQDSIAAYSKKKNMSDFSKQWAYIDFKYIIANYLMGYDNPEANRWEVFTNPIFDVFNENNFQTMNFQYHLPVCMSALANSDVEISRLFSEEKYVAAIRLTIEKLIEKTPKGVVRDYMLLKILESMQEMPELYDSIPDIKAKFSQDFFHKKLEEVVEKSKNIEQILKLSDKERQLDEIFYMTESGSEKLHNVKLLNYFTEKYKGKVLYIDVWATWCGPCLGGFKVTPTLHNYFEGKDVVFVNLCLASNIETWKPTIEENNIDGENYFLGNNATQLFMAEHNLPGYPSYLLIDKNGELHKPVPRPSDLESAIRKIESCLK